MSTIVDGVRMDHVRSCACGKRPVIHTAYKGHEPGMGPFIVSCPDQASVQLEGPPWIRWEGCGWVRSWSKTRAVRLWRRLVGRVLQHRAELAEEEAAGPLSRVPLARARRLGRQAVESFRELAVADPSTRVDLNGQAQVLVLEARIHDGRWCATRLIGELDSLPMDDVSAVLHDLVDAVRQAVEPAVVDEIVDRLEAELDARRCRVCGCTSWHGCAEGCWWVEDDLCSSCHTDRDEDHDEDRDEDRDDELGRDGPARRPHRRRLQRPPRAAMGEAGERSGLQPAHR